MGESITDVVFSLIAADAPASSGDGSNSWLVPAIFAVLAAAIWWLMRGKFTDMQRHFDTSFGGLVGTDKRLEGKLDKGLGELQIGITDIVREVTSIDRRVFRIETEFGLGPLGSHSPVRLTEAGKKILAESGIKEAADANKGTLLNSIKNRHPETAYDVQKITRDIFQNIAWSSDVVKKIKEYSFESGQWGLYDILDVGAVYFRDIALREFGYEVADVDASDPDRQ